MKLNDFIDKKLYLDIKALGMESLKLNIETFFKFIVDNNYFI